MYDKIKNNRQMKNIKNLSIIILGLSFMGSCIMQEEIDKEKPTIDLTIADVFPSNCDTLYFGESFVMKMLFTDNVELGSKRAFSIDIHNNFDHHSHSTEVTECSLGPIKDPINPFVFIEDFNIPAGLSEYETNVSISVPAMNESGLYDAGDYHFFISLSDNEGWSTQKGLSVKLLHR